MIKDQTNHLLNGTLQSWRSENQRGEKSKQVILDAGFLKFYLALQDILCLLLEFNNFLAVFYCMNIIFILNRVLSRLVYILI